MSISEVFPNNLGFFEDYLSNLNYVLTVIGLYMTYRNEYDKEAYYLKVCNVATTCRENKKGGGTWQGILLLVYYIWPQMQILKMFVEHLSLIMDKIDVSSFMGDYNISILTHNVHPHIALVLDTLNGKSCVTLVTRPKRSRGNSHTLSDNIITNSIEGLQYAM